MSSSDLETTQRWKVDADSAQTSPAALYCRSTPEGTIAPHGMVVGNAELQGVFESGMTLAGRYRLLQPLGSGAMGRVFLSQDSRLSRLVAVKVVVHQRTSLQDSEAELEREAKLGASLNHAGIAAVLDFGFHDNRSYTVFEFVEGDTLRALLWRRGRMPLPEAQRIIHELALALDYAHSRGIIHRDLKPENVSLTKRGEFKILDFGIARDLRQELRSGQYSGTPTYSSPEQAACRHMDGRSDQYALALIAFEMLSGKKVFDVEDPMQVLQHHLHEIPTDPRMVVPNLPDSAGEAILRALSKRPQDRFATCQDFADSFGRDSLHTPRHAVLVPVEQRLAFHIGHGAEDSVLAGRLARELEQRGYRCWSFGRNARTGSSCVTQIEAALARAQAAIYLISRSGLHSTELQLEMESALEIGIPRLCLLVDIPRETFEQTTPTWRTLLASPPIDVANPIQLENLLDTLLNVASNLAIQPDMPAAKMAPGRRTPSRQSWVTDANQIEMDALERVVFQNEVIATFLSRRNKHFLVGTKGLGKTLLLTRKRQLLTNDASEEQSLTLIPEGRPYLDFMSEMRSLSSQYQRPLADLSMTKRLWGTALRISVISHHPTPPDGSRSSGLSDFPERFHGWFGNRRVEPTVAFKELTAMPLGQLSRLIDKCENELDERLRRIHAATYVFVDKVDQAIRHLTREAWIAMQAGLIEAAWEIMNANSHVKIYATIRQEAFANYQSHTKSNLFGAITTLEYSSDDLRRLVDGLSQYYEAHDSLAAFLGLQVVRHARCNYPEGSFEFVLRHTLGRPRDLVTIASELSANRTSLSEASLRQLVERTSGAAIVANVFEEVHVFLDCLEDESTRRRFLALIPCNIITRGEAIHICEEFNGLEPETIHHLGEESPEIHHPFRDLYLAGLLGCLDHDAASGRQLQRFRQPYDSFDNPTVPESDFYFVHPALHHVINEARNRKPYIRIEQLQVGHLLPWRPLYGLIVKLERRTNAIDDSRFREIVMSVAAQVLAIVESGSSEFARHKVEAQGAWDSLQPYFERARYREVCLEVDDLLNAF